MATLKDSRARALVSEILGSCGKDRCELSRKKLEGEGPISLSEFRVGESGWEMPVFERLFGYAQDEHVDELDIVDVAKYFGGRHHILQMISGIRLSSITRDLGEDAGLVLDVLLPLEEDTYRNGDQELVINGMAERGNLGGDVRCFHRGLVVSLPLSREDVEHILREQRESPEFMGALRRLNGAVTMPPNLIRALKMQA